MRRFVAALAACFLAGIAGAQEDPDARVSLRVEGRTLSPEGRSILGGSRSRAPTRQEDGTWRV